MCLNLSPAAACAIRAADTRQPPPPPTKHPKQTKTLAPKQNLALNVAEKGFPISVFNRSYDKTEAAVARAQKEGVGEKLRGFREMADFVASLERPRRVIILVQAGAPVDSTIENLCKYMEPGDIIVDGGNEWFENTERRAALVESKGLLYMGMGVSGGEEGARNGPSLMPGGSAEAFKALEPVISRVAAQVDDGPCTMYVGKGGSGNFVKMVHNGIEYGDMQLISEAYDVLRTLGGFTNAELADTFKKWNEGALQSYLVEITSIILAKQDDRAGAGAKAGEALVDRIVDKTGAKGTGKWTVQRAAELSVPAPTIAASLDGRYISALKSERVAAAAFYAPLGIAAPCVAAGVDKAALAEDVRKALYCAKVCSYAQGMNIIRAQSETSGWSVDLGGLARIWKGGCIIRAAFLDDIKQAYLRDPALPNLLVDGDFARGIAEQQEAWRRVVGLAVASGVSVAGMSSSLAYFDAYRRARLPANLVQAQRDFFGSHTYERDDAEGWHHTVWDARYGSADSITTKAYHA